MLPRVGKCSAAPAALEEGVPGKIYTRFYASSPDLDQFVSSDLTRGLYPPEYLQANMDLLKKNVALALAYGLRPALPSAPANDA